MATIELPDYYRVLDTPSFDATSIGCVIHEIAPSNNNQSGLNGGTSRFVFNYSGGQKCIRLHPYLCGFRVRAAFRTKSAGNNSRVADITLANNWFWHLWRQYTLKLTNKNSLEDVGYIGEFADIMSVFKGYEAKRMNGQLNGIIPDEGSGRAADVPVIVRNPAVTAGAAIPANFLTVANNPNYNAGYKRRKELYNYPVAGDGDRRQIEQFFPLFFSGFFNTDTCLMNTSFEITLTRKPPEEYRNAVFGADGTDIDFGASPDTGLLSVTLELLEQVPEKITVEPSLLSIFANTNKVPKPLMYLKASVKQFDWGIDKGYKINSNEYTVPRFIFIGLKGKGVDGRDAAANTADCDNNTTRNWSLFKHGRLESIQVSINGQKFPNSLQDADYSVNEISKFYQSYLDVCRALPYGGSVSLDMVDFRNLYPIYAFNCESQEPKVSTQNCNLLVELKRKNTPRENTDPDDPLGLQIFMVVLEDQYVMVNAVQGSCSAYSVPV